jgi:uncharacterized membrane protein YjjP (DUF1212 family)
MNETPVPSTRTRTRTREELADYLLDIGATLASYGCPTYRLEDVIRLVADVEGYRADPFALPTGLFLRVTLKPDEAGRIPHAPEVHRMTRLSEAGVDLERLGIVDEIFNAVADRKLTIEAARERIHAITKQRPHWSGVLVWAASTVAAGGAAVFFRGSAMDVLVASVVGAVIGGSRLALPGKTERLLHEFLGGLFAAVAAWLGARLWHQVSPEVVILAGAISLFPGMTFTTGVAEVTQKHIVSGGARLVESAVTLLLIVFGVALVTGFQQIAGVILPAAPARPGLGLGWQAAALVASSVSFGVLFQVPRRWLWAALASGATGYAVTALAVRSLPSHVAAFCAALAVCVLANALARATKRPVQLFQLPGMMLLVPGSVGFVGLGAFLRGDVEQGLKNGFAMALVGAALVIGVLVANAVVPSRKLL